MIVTNVPGGQNATLPPTAAEINADAIRAAAASALATNRAILNGADTYLAITSPTAAQVTAQVRGLTQAVRALAQQNSGLIRLVLGLLDSSD